MFKNSIFLCVAFIFITTACYSEYDTSKLGGAAGAYLCSVDMLERFLNSECGYIVKKKYTYEETLDEVLSVFNHKERMEMVRFVNEGKFNNMLMENDEFINGFLQECKKDSLDQNTLCGMIAQNITLIYKNAHSNWTHAVER